MNKIRDLIYHLRPLVDEYRSLMEQWKEAVPGSQEVANLHASFKAKQHYAGKAFESGDIEKLLHVLENQEGTPDKVDTYWIAQNTGWGSGTSWFHTGGNVYAEPRYKTKEAALEANAKGKAYLNNSTTKFRVVLVERKETYYE